jgi:hypothetical protein
MKALILFKNSSIKLVLMFFTLFLLASTQADAGHRHHHKMMLGLGGIYVPTATCSVFATGEPLPQYQCCQLRDRKGHRVWSDTWVSGSCKNAHVSARYDLGCKIDSPVYSTGAPINANCQFAYTTGMYPMYH